MVSFIDGNRRAPLQERSRQRVDRILGSAAQLLANFPPEKISIRKIAQTANVSVGTIYQFFENKSAVFDSLGDSFEAAILDRCRDSLTVQLAKENLQEFVIQLMLAIDDTQRDHEGFVCIVRGNQHSHFSDLIQRIRSRVKEHLGMTLSKAYPNVDSNTHKDTLSIFEASAMSIMNQLPLKGDPRREHYLRASVELLAPFLKTRLAAEK